MKISVNVPSLRTTLGYRASLGVKKISKVPEQTLPGLSNFVMDNFPVMWYIFWAIPYKMAVSSVVKKMLGNSDLSESNV